MSVSDYAVAFLTLSVLTRTGFVVKIKKLLETCCFNCGRILADYVSLPREDGVPRLSMPTLY